jgi:hypothetical protein
LLALFKKWQAQKVCHFFELDITWVKRQLTKEFCLSPIPVLGRKHILMIEVTPFRGAAEMVQQL